MCYAVYQDSAKYILLSGNSNEDRIGRQKETGAFFFLTTLWCASNKCPNYTQPIHTMTHKHLCFHEGAQMYLKKTDLLLYYCQGEASSEKKVMSGKHQPSNVYAQVQHLLKILNNLLLVLLKKTTTSLIRESYKVRRCSIRQCQGLHVIIQMTTSSSSTIP